MRRTSPPLLALSTLLLLAGCGRTGLTVPTFIERRPTPPPSCNTQPATITIVPTVTLAAGLPSGQSAMRFVDWTISNTCATQSPPNPPNSTAIGPRRRLLCFILNGVNALASERRISGDCSGTPGGGTPETFFVDDSVPGQPGTRLRQLVALRITGGNVCIRGTITFVDGSTAEMPLTMWRVTTVAAPAMGYIVQPAAGGVRANPIGLGSPDCPAE